MVSIWFAVTAAIACTSLLLLLMSCYLLENLSVIVGAFGIGATTSTLYHIVLI